MSDDNKSNKNPIFSQIKSDLTKAMEKWEQACDQAGEVPPDEQRLQEMKALLCKLQDKIKELSS